MTFLIKRVYACRGVAGEIASPEAQSATKALTPCCVREDIYWPHPIISQELSVKRIATITSIGSMALGALATIASASAGAATGPEYFPMPGPSLPFSESVLVGRRCMCRVRLASLRTLNLVPGGIGPETTA